MKILVTGASGFIGSHTVLVLLEAGHEVVGVDNLTNSSRESLRRVESLTHRRVRFIEADIRDRAAMADVMKASSDRPFDAVMHLAGLKAVSESTQQPLTYYENNLDGTLALLDVMQSADIRRIIFSSSATVYGDPVAVPIPETAPVGQPAHPYGYTKLMIERVLCDLASADPRWSVALLRYFNPVGAHPSGQIGEDPSGTPNNLVPFISQVAVGRRDALTLYGDDYSTPDGTGVRDYIHVMDLARGHLAALDYLAGHDVTGSRIWNLGTGRGYSVREVIAAFEKAAERTIPVRVAPRRPGDIAACYADPTLAQAELGWRPEYKLDAMMRDAWNWQRQNPAGYSD